MFFQLWIVAMLHGASYKLLFLGHCSLIKKNNFSISIIIIIIIIIIIHCTHYQHSDWPREMKRPPVIARHIHTPKLLLYFYFKENNSMRHLGATNLVCNHSRLRFLNAKSRIISSHQRYGVLMYVAHMHMRMHVVLTCVRHLHALARVCEKHDPPAYVSRLYVSVCTRMFTVK